MQDVLPDILNNQNIFPEIVGGRVPSWLMRSTPERAVRIRALAGDIMLCSWTRHFTLTLPLSTQVYKWLPANCWGNLPNCEGVTCDELVSRRLGEVEILLAASCYRNQMSSGSYGPVLAPRLHFFFPEILILSSEMLDQTTNAFQVLEQGACC